MQENDKPILIYTTTPSPEVAEQLSGVLLDQKLAACVNVLPGMISHYMWQGQRERGLECAVLVKTRVGLRDAVMAVIEANHPYDTPAVLALDVTAASDAFAAWILAEARATS